MLKGIKRKLQENKELKEQGQQEAERLRQLTVQAGLEEERKKREFQDKVLAILQDGKVPDLGLDISVPFKLQKNEKWILAVNNVAYAEMRVKREIVGRSAGMSVRVMKGVSVRVKREIVGRSAGMSVRVMKGVSVRTGASKGTPRDRCPYSQGKRSIRTLHKARVFQR